jgi:adenylate cyclase
MSLKDSKLYVMSGVTALLYLWLYSSPYIKYIDYKIYDFFSQKLDIKKSEKNAITPSVVIVEIDKKSINALGQWPWHRIVTANLINKINTAHPSAIGLNIMFRQEDKSSVVSLQKFYKNYMGYQLKVRGLPTRFFDNDKILADAFARARIVLPVYMQDTPLSVRKCDPILKDAGLLKDATTTYRAASMLCNIDQLHNRSYGFGFINTQIDKDGVLRRSPLFIRYKKEIIPAFALANLLAIDKNIAFPSPGCVKILDHEFHINSASEVLLYFYEPKRYKRVSAIDILENKIPENQLAGKIVLVGTSLIGDSNKHIVTTSDALNGTDVSATIIENIVNDHLLWQPEILKPAGVVLAFLLSVVAVIMVYRKLYYHLVVWYVTVFVLSFFIAWLLFLYGIYISIAYFWIPLLIHFILLSFVVLYLNDREKKRYYRELSSSHSAALASMVLVAGTKDFETGAHLNRTKEYMKLLAHYLKEKGVYSNVLSDDFIDIIYHAAPLHDIGKVGIPDAILQKPGKLDENEFKIMKEHPKLGMEIIQKAMRYYSENSFLHTAYNIAYFHHEKWDGSGYPCGLKGEEIPLEARLMALVDVYDALISRRCYKEAFSYEKAENIIISESGKHFDPKIADSFKELKKEFREIAQRYR